MCLPHISKFNIYTSYNLIRCQSQSYDAWSSGTGEREREREIMKGIREREMKMRGLEREKERIRKVM